MSETTERERFMALAEKTLDLALCNCDEAGDARQDAICDIADALAQVHREAVSAPATEDQIALALYGQTGGIWRNAVRNLKYKIQSENGGG